MDVVTLGAAKADAKKKYAPANNDPFRYDSTRLRAFKAALAKRNATPVDILLLGDSITEGQGITAPNINSGLRWVDKLRDLLRAAWQPAGVAGGYGYRSIIYAVSGYGNQFTLTGTGAAQNTAGLGRKRYLLAQGATATATFTGTGLDLFFLGGINGTFTYAIDGGSAVSVNTMTDGSAATVGSRVQVRSLSAASHTIVITITGAQNVYFEGMMVYNGDETKGIRLWEGARSGQRTLDFIDDTGLYYNNYTPVQPDLVSIGLGTNDYVTSQVINKLTPAQTKANLKTIIASIRAKCTVPPSIILWQPAEVKNVASALAPWADYLKAIEEVAKEDGAITLFDANTLMGDQLANVYGLLSADKIHPSDDGHMATADSLFALLRKA
jgi:VCBS repeat-containing protein